MQVESKKKPAYSVRREFFRSLFSLVPACAVQPCARGRVREVGVVARVYISSSHRHEFKPILEQNRAATCAHLLAPRRDGSSASSIRAVSPHNLQRDARSSTRSSGVVLILTPQKSEPRHTLSCLSRAGACVSGSKGVSCKTTSTRRYIQPSARATRYDLNTTILDETIRRCGALPGVCSAVGRCLELSHATRRGRLMLDA